MSRATFAAGEDQPEAVSCDIDTKISNLSNEKTKKNIRLFHIIFYNMLSRPEEEPKGVIVIIMLF